MPNEASRAGTSQPRSSPLAFGPWPFVLVIWRARQFEFRFPRPALVMGIVNVTPDSFSDG